MNELPTIGRSAMTACVMNMTSDNTSGAWIGSPRPIHWSPAAIEDAFQRIYTPPPVTKTVTSKKEQPVAVAKRRLVRVLVVDPDENVPTDKCLLHAGGEQFTDATDQELFFEIDIKSILDRHNEYRVTLTEKGKTEKAKKLEPARIRDLKMVVVTLAEF